MRVSRRLSGRVAICAAAALIAGAFGAPIGQATTVVRAPASLVAGAVAPPSTDRGVVPKPVTPTVRSYAVDGVSSAGLRALPVADRKSAGALAALSAPEPANGFAVTGVTWRGAAPGGLAVAIRSRTDGHWSEWAAMPFDADHGPTPGTAEARQARPGTDPFVVGAVDRVQLKVTSASGRVPRGLSLDVVNPGHSPDDRPAALAKETSASAIAATDPVVATNPTPMPTIYSRAEWGADESMRGCCTEYGEVHAGYVHHTVNANDYSRREVPAILRGIYAYHTQSRGWRDIGYNFLIDRFGRIWEGRYGGVTLPVVGAHTLDYNENSFGTSAIGNYQVAQPSSAMLDAYAHLFAWKLSLSGVRPSSRQNVAGTMFNAISGHRDAAQTACPGIHLYKKIPQIIAKATTYQHTYTGRETQHSFIRDTAPDVLTVNRASGQLGIARGTGAPGFDPPQLALTSYGGHDQVVAVGDVTGDKAPDLMARSASTGAMQVLSGSGSGAFVPAKGSTMKFAHTDLFAGPGDLDGDGVNDVVARDTSTGSLMFYRGHAAGGFGAPVVAVSKASGLNLLTAAGDFNGDGKGDLLGRGSAGALIVYLGDGTGAFQTSRTLPGSWKGMDLIAGGLDLTGDGRPDVVARNSYTGQTRIFANVGGTRLAPGIATLAPTASAITTLSLSRDVTGDGRPDLVVTTAKGNLLVIPATRQNWFTPSRERPAVWKGVNRVMVVGDWDRDGYTDAMARDSRTGRMWLYPGGAGGGLGDRVGGWHGWKAQRLLAPVGDFNGDGYPDVMAKAANGHIYLYPGRGDRGFGSPIIVRSSLPGAVTIIPVGLWTADGAPDILVKTSSGRLLLYKGNGPGGLEDPLVVARNVDQYDTMIGVGDVTGDGTDDLLGRTPDGDVWLVPGVAPSAQHPAGGLGPRQYLSSGWSRYRLG